MVRPAPWPLGGLRLALFDAGKGPLLAPSWAQLVEGVLLLVLGLIQALAPDTAYVARCDCFAPKDLPAYRLQGVLLVTLGIFQIQGARTGLPACVAYGLLIDAAVVLPSWFILRWMYETTQASLLLLNWLTVVSAVFVAVTLALWYPLTSCAAFVGFLQPSKQGWTPLRVVLNVQGLFYNVVGALFIQYPNWFNSESGSAAPTRLTGVLMTAVGCFYPFWEKEDNEFLSANFIFCRLVLVVPLMITVGLLHEGAWSTVARPVVIDSILALATYVAWWCQATKQPPHVELQQVDT